MSYLCYLIANGRRTYVGITNNFTRRIRQHNGEIKGGARYTKSNYDPTHPWRPLCMIKGIRSKGAAMSIEKWIKVHTRNRLEQPVKAMSKGLRHYQDRHPEKGSLGWTIEIH